MNALAILLLGLSAVGYEVGGHLFFKMIEFLVDWIVRFTTGSGLAGLCALVAACIAYMGVGRTVHTQQSIREDEKWWQQFNWLMDRTFPATGQEHRLPLEVVSTLLHGLILPSNDGLRNSTALKASDILHKSGLSSGRTAELEESILKVGKANAGAERLWETVILRRISGLNDAMDLKVGRRVVSQGGNLRLDAELQYGDEKYALEFKVGGSRGAVESYFRQGLEMERKLAGEYSGIIFVLADFAEDDFLMSRGKVCLTSLHRLQAMADFQRCIEEIKK